MKQRAGTFIAQKQAGESFKAFIPAKLPPDPSLNLAQLYPYLEKATLALAELNSICQSIPNIELFIYMYVRKEALLSSQIEGTQSSFSDLMLFEHKQKLNVAIEDVEEVSNYVKAINYGLGRLKDGFPLSLRLLREIHSVLLSGTRGRSKTPGEFRNSQNWIGGTRPGNALFVPPPVTYLGQCLADFENFLHNNELPILIKAGLTHVQFESIHPFLDGNGRLGRLIIILLLCESGVIKQPILYLSLYLKQNQQLYYNLLQEVRNQGHWETWLEFFLDGIYKSSKLAVLSAKRINHLFAEDFFAISNLGRSRFSCQRILEFMQKLPQVTVGVIATKLNISAPTARQSLEILTRLGILEEISNRKRDKIYLYKKYLNILGDSSNEKLI